MTDFVLDNSVSMRWLLASEKASDQKYAENVLESMRDVDVLTPNLWHLEAISVLIGAEKRGEVSLGEIERFISQLENLPIHVDPLTAHQAFSRTLVLSREYNISSYDASYLELAMREGLPLSSLDKKLVKAAKKADVDIYKP
ncbi:MAG: PIN domain-containing protein [Gammaproteobacteria bacterium]|nr:PIN domain-containing protein [Gammaproteobacteria bacterium]